MFQPSHPNRGCPLGIRMKTDEGWRWLFQREAQIPQRSGKIWRLTEKRGRSTKQENDKSSKNAGKGSFLDVKPEGLSFTEEPLLKKATKLTWSSGGNLPEAAHSRFSSFGEKPGAPRGRANCRLGFI